MGQLVQKSLGGFGPRQLSGQLPQFRHPHPDDLFCGHRGHQSALEIPVSGILPGQQHIPHPARRGLGPQGQPLAQLVQNHLVGGAKLIFFDLLGGDPGHGRVFQHPGRSLADAGAEQSEMDGGVGVGVGDLEILLSHLHADVQFLPAFPGQGLLGCLPRLHLAPHKLPEQPPGLVGGPLADQKAAVGTDKRRHDFQHILLPFFLV